MTMNTELIERLAREAFNRNPGWESSGSVQAGGADRFYIDLGGEEALLFCECLAALVAEECIVSVYATDDFGPGTADAIEADIRAKFPMPEPPTNPA